MACIVREETLQNYTRSVANEIGAMPADEFCIRSEHMAETDHSILSIPLSEMIANGTMPQGPVLVGGAKLTVVLIVLYGLAEK